MDNTRPEQDVNHAKSLMQLPMVHYASLKWYDLTLRFKPGTSFTLIGPEDPLYILGGYVLPITIDSNTPPSFYRPDQTMLAAMVCQADACFECNDGSISKEDIQDYVMWKVNEYATGKPIVHRVHVGQTAEGVLVFDHRLVRMPRYLVNPPTKYRIAEIAFSWTDKGVEKDSVCEVVVCEEGGCEVCDGRKQGSGDE